MKNNKVTVIVKFGAASVSRSFPRDEKVDSRINRFVEEESAKRKTLANSIIIN